MRRHRPDRGLAGTDELLAPDADAGAVRRLCAWVLEEVCLRLADWRARGLAGDEFSMAVDLSPRQLADDGLVPLVETTLRAHGLPAGALCLEVPESALLAGGDVPARLRALRGLGVRIAVDGFGLGWGAPAGLAPLPRASRSSPLSLAADAVKLDRRLVADMAAGPQAAHVVGAVVGPRAHARAAADRRGRGHARALPRARRPRGGARPGQRVLARLLARRRGGAAGRRRPPRRGGRGPRAGLPVRRRPRAAGAVARLPGARRRPGGRGRGGRRRGARGRRARGRGRRRPARPLHAQRGRPRGARRPAGAGRRPGRDRALRLRRAPHGGAGAGPRRGPLRREGHPDAGDRRRSCARS